MVHDDRSDVDQRTERSMIAFTMAVVLLAPVMLGLGIYCGGKMFGLW